MVDNLLPRRLVGFFLVWLSTGNALAAPQGGICGTQLVADVGERFDQTVTRIEFSYITSKGGRGGGSSSTALVYVDGCPGYHVYDVYATDYDCEARAHIGTPPRYVRYRTSSGGC